MKTLGLIGGLTWHSTVDYYRLINRMINERLGGHHSANLLLCSVNFAEYLPRDEEDWWQDTARRLTAIAQTLEKGGADALVLCANTAHKVAPQIQAGIGIRVIHIADATAIKPFNLTCVALLGTRFTMKEAFYPDRLRQAGIETIVPEADDREFINNSIFNELGKGILLPATRDRYSRIIDDLRGRSAQGVILGCTEIPLIIKQEDFSIPLFDTTHIHATAAVDFALGD